MIHTAYVALSWLLHGTSEYYSFYIDKTCMRNHWVNLDTNILRRNNSRFNLDMYLESYIIYLNKSIALWQLRKHLNEFRT